jgi:hypothetical protein
MYLGTGRQLEAIRRIAHASDDLVGTIVAWCQLAATEAGKGCCLAMESTHPVPVTDLEGDVMMLHDA